ncbi:MAG: glutathione S-transferase N-terminal domain-containing protein [Proteobacteria bacterium]|nr:glutathione S-transferase N-terminal domain-containing protein [Pseudomonadota bacterium]
MYTLYGSRGSGSAAVEAALVVAGVPWQGVEAASWEASEGLEALKRINPLAQIPTLVSPGGDVLTESAAILIALGLAHPESGLLSTDAAARDRSVRGLVYIAANCYAAIGVIDYPERWCTSDDKAVLDMVRKGTRQRLHELWERFADQFPAAPWLGGERLGALDLLASVVSRWSGTRPHLAAARPDFHALLQRIDHAPSVAAVFDRHWPPRG